MEGDLAVADGLECGQVRQEPPVEQSLHLLNPAPLDHPGHAARDLIV